ncbi:hypothetical protein [Flavobacterium sp.]|uniref:hypothetical protein n=1 Tax=Flavobacterium sp. TaxID=239 RepID=UPI00286A061A|nr:hypothetical protein [Flavobacterium sp.]
MKGLILAATILMGLGLNAQTTVFEKQFGDSIKEINCGYLKKSNKLIISSHNKSKKASLLFIDSEQNQSVILNNYEFDGFNFSTAEKAFSIFEAKNNIADRYKYFAIDNITSKEYIKKHVRFPYLNFFTKKFQLELVNSTGNIKVNLLKDDIFCKKRDINSNIEELVKVTKPNIECFANPDKPNESDLAFQKRLIDDNSFEIVTKRILYDISNATCNLYRTQYDLEGKIINNFKYSYSLPSNLVPASTRSKSRIENEMCDFSSSLNYFNNMDVNEYLIDDDTQDVYIFGVTRDSKTLSPKGFYAVKFKKTGEMIWNRVFEIDDKKGFNNDRYLIEATIEINEYLNDNLLAFSIDGGTDDRYNNLFVIDKQTGNLVDKASKETHREGLKGALSFRRTSIFESSRLLKNRYGNVNVLLAMSFNKKINDFITQNNLKAEVHYDAILSKKGIWLLESDNKTYFKVTLFRE